jgi:hypothetical protein
MTNAGPRVAQQRLQTLDNRVDALVAELEALAAERQPSDAYTGNPQTHRGNSNKSETGVRSGGKGWPGLEGSPRPPGPGGREPRPGGWGQGTPGPTTPPKPIVHPDPEILTDFDRIAREHLLIWLAISLAILGITFGLPFVLALF